GDAPAPGVSIGASGCAGPRRPPSRSAGGRQSAGAPKQEIRLASPPTVYAFEGIVPVIDPTAYVHPAAVLIGDVIVGPGCYVGPGASLRGDFGRIVLERNANVQDNCVVHSRPDFDCVMAEESHVGHGAVIHCARIGRDAMVGINAVVM